MSVDPETVEERMARLGRNWLAPAEAYRLALPVDLSNLAGIPRTEVPAALRGPNYRRTT
ncbi:hypothetical protein [Streptomyces albidoflavus]|uniref:hypothetical protein n=1 Tax=Streptomyces albidoflavus TaxID=1886 RepID=UPI00344E3F05